MGLQNVYQGRQSWADYLGSQSYFAELAEVMKARLDRKQASGLPGDAASIEVKLSSRDYHLALDSGLGAIGDEIGPVIVGAEHRLVLGVDKLTGGIGQLNADFNLLMGDLVWKFEL